MARLEIGRDTLCPECFGRGGKEVKKRAKPDEPGEWFKCAICGGHGYVNNQARQVPSRKI